ncbi:MAG TPA: SirB2 family protein [Pseudomonadales bacterium]|nr:SirB2 family protein [Pseudomonadales bacterium]
MSELYPAIKSLHMLFATISICGLLLRTFWKMTGSAMLDAKPVKILPHINDTLLLGCGIALAVIAGINPFTHLWLLAKLGLLLAYIGCGVFILKKAESNATRALGLFFALVCFAGMGGLAAMKPF